LLRCENVSPLLVVQLNHCVESSKEFVMPASFLLAILIAISTSASATVPVGTIALYSDGRVEKLVAIEGDGLRWEDDRMRQYLRSTNPIMPVLESRQPVTGKGYTQRLKSGDPSRVKRVPLGQPTHFTTVRNDDAGAKTRYWKCEFLGESSEKVLEQSRIVERYRCQRSSLSLGRFPGLRVRDTREFTFSPELGVIVQLKRKTAKGSRSRELIALFKPGSIDQETLSRKVQKVRD
jgi:hypothetical protein